MDTEANMEYEKYLKSFELIQAVVDVAKDNDTCTAKWDELNTYIHANFSPCSDENFDADIDSIREMFKIPTDELKQKLYEIPPTISEECFPFAVHRYLICNIKCHVFPSQSTTHEEFHRRHGRHIYKLF